MKCPFYWVDAFATRPYEGNPAGVCFVEEFPADEEMRLPVEEMSLSEIAFLRPENAGFRIRWFTPNEEVDLCGHATLASAHVLWETGRAHQDVLEFASRSGPLRATRGEKGVILDFPLVPGVPVATPPLLAQMTPGILTSVASARDLVIELESEYAVRAFDPSIAHDAYAPHQALCVTACSEDPQFDFVSRFFAARFGIVEDPATGSVHCTLGPFWAERLGKTKLVARQLSDRGATIGVDLTSKPGRVWLEGSAVTLFAGELRL